MYGHTDMDTDKNFQVRIRLYGVSRYAVFPYVQFWTDTVVRRTQICRISGCTILANLGVYQGCSV